MVNEVGRVSASEGTTLLRMWRVEVPAGNRGARKHSHPCFEISTVLKGTGVYTVSSSVYPMETGDFFVFSGGEQHSISDVGDGGLELLNLQFEPRYFMGSSQDSLSEANTAFCFSHGRDFVNRIEAEKAEGIRKLFYAIENELKGGGSEYALCVKSYLNLIAVALIRDFGYTVGRTALSRHNLHSIRRVITHIDLNLAEELTLDGLASIAGVSPSYFSSLFHETVGITLWDYVNSRRIDKALRLLTKDESRNILEIAFSCGFNNTANFNKVFKKVTGMTPTEYRATDDGLLAYGIRG